MSNMLEFKLLISYNSVFNYSRNIYHLSIKFYSQFLLLTNYIEDVVYFGASGTVREKRVCKLQIVMFKNALSIKSYLYYCN